MRKPSYIYIYISRKTVKNDHIGVFTATHCGKGKKHVIFFIYWHIIDLLIIMYVKSLPVLLLSCKTRCSVN